MRKGVLMVGSKSDLPQCLEGLRWTQANFDRIILERVYVSSQHRHTLNTQRILTDLSARADIDFLIVGAGWANHLTGCSDAWLRYALRNKSLPVIGVAFEDPKSETHNQAAVLSITEVPDTKVIYKDEDGIFWGRNGFLRACRFAAFGDFPQITIKEPPPAMELSCEEALALANG